MKSSRSARRPLPKIRWGAAGSFAARRATTTAAMTEPGMKAFGIFGLAKAPPIWHYLRQHLTEAMNRLHHRPERPACACGKPMVYAQYNPSDGSYWAFCWKCFCDSVVKPLMDDLEQQRRQCRKCLCTDIIMEHMRAGDRWKAAHKRRESESDHVIREPWHTIAKIECLVCQCTNCGYEWETPPADAVRDANLNDEP